MTIAVTRPDSTHPNGTSPSTTTHANGTGSTTSSTWSTRPKAQALLSDPSLAQALPSDFLYGCATASYQIEGAYDTDGKGLNVWDVCLKDRENGEVACDSYHLWRKDIALLEKYGCNSYRFSISWARLIPLGGKDDPVNQAGIDYYNQLIDTLIAKGIKPLATIFHWDLPQALQDRYGGFLSDEIIPDFVAFARLCFKHFGDRVKDWCSFNEPMIFAMQSSSSFLGPGWVHKRDHAILARTTLLSHARAVECYRKEFAAQGGRIGLVLNCDWLEGVDDSAEAAEAAQWALDWVMGMYAGPIYTGSVPPSVLAYLGSQAGPLHFSPEEQSVLRGSSDFFGWNHYGTQLTSGKRIETEVPRLVSFGSIERVFERDGKAIGVRGEAGHPYDVPWGFRKLLRYISTNYCVPNDIPVIITECGFTPDGEASMTWEERINDVTRQDYYAGYLKEMVEAVRDDGVRVDGFMAWSLMDNIEWLYGYDKRFGITAVDDQLVRHPKDSSKLLRAIFEHTMKAKAQ